LPCNDQLTFSTHKIRQRLSVHTLQVKTMKRIMIKLAAGSLHWKLLDKFNFHLYRSNTVPTSPKIYDPKRKYNFPKAVYPTKNIVQLSHYRKIMSGAERFRSLGFPTWLRQNLFFFAKVPHRSLSPLSLLRRGKPATANHPVQNRR
jgi:hypothetical protein